MPPSSDFGNVSTLDDSYSSLIMDKLSEFSICYEHISPHSPLVGVNSRSGSCFTLKSKLLRYLVNSVFDSF